MHGARRYSVSFDRTLPNVLLHLSGAAADNGEPITQYQWQVKLSDQWGNPTDCGSDPNDLVHATDDSDAQK